MSGYEVPRELVTEVQRQIGLTAKEAKRLVLSISRGLDWTDATTARAQLVELMRPVIEQYSGAASLVYAEFYDLTKDVAGVAAAESAATVAFDAERATAMDKAVRAIVTPMVKGNVAEFERQLGDRVEYEMRRTMWETALHNGHRENKRVRFARVPGGGDTCQWCIMLASRGFVYHSEETAMHTHANCNCTPVCDHGRSDAKVDGYDPSAYLEQYKNNTNAIGD